MVRSRRALFFLALFVLFSTSIPVRLQAQSDPPGHLEQLDDPPSVTTRTATETADAAVVEYNGYVSVQVNVGALGNNIIGDAANEPSIAVDPNNPARVAIGWRQFDTIASNFRQAGVAYTADGGQNWTSVGPLNPGVFRSDPVLDADGDGEFFYNSLTNEGGGFSCDVYRSSDGGATWENGVYAFGGDKQWMTIDRTFGIGRGNVYAYWTSAFSCCNGQFTRSYNNGASYIAPIDIPGNPQWGTLSVGPDGALYIAGRGFTVAKSSTIQDPQQPAAFDFTRSVFLDGSVSFSGGPNPGGLMGQAWIATDHSQGPTRGNVYLLATVNRFSVFDPADVMFARSTDGGSSCSAPVRVNDDPQGNGAYQWFGTMSVAPNGRIDVIWNDTRNDPGGFTSQLHYSYSLDAGQTFAPSEAVSPPFNPRIGWPNQNKIGDYYDMFSDNGGASIAYAATFNGEQDVYFLRIGEIDCNNNGISDEDDLAAGTSGDCDSNSVPDECQRDCNQNGEPDVCDIDAGISLDCNENRLADECEAPDCNDNDVPDECELAAGSAADCNGNGIPDLCDIASGASGDCNLSGTPDSCEVLALAADLPEIADAEPCPGEDAVFHIDYPAATAYRWYRAGEPLNDDSSYSGTTTATLTVYAADAADETSYRCRVSTGCISAQSPPAELGLAPLEIVIVREPVAQAMACADSLLTAQFSVQLENARRATFAWSKDDVPLTAGGVFMNVDAAALDIVELSPAVAGMYSCHIENACGATADTDPSRGELIVVDPAFTAGPGHACAEVSGSVAFSAALESADGLLLVWTRDGVEISDGVDASGAVVSGANTTTLAVENVPASFDGSTFALGAVVPSPFCSATSFSATLLVGSCPACSLPGDMDADGDNDLADFKILSACFGRDATTATDCACADVAPGSLIDLADWARLETLLTGPR